jgi:hypothetical protein
MCETQLHLTKKRFLIGAVYKSQFSDIDGKYTSRWELRVQDYQGFS